MAVLFLQSSEVVHSDSSVNLARFASRQMLRLAFSESGKDLGPNAASSQLSTFANRLRTWWETRP